MSQRSSAKGSRPPHGHNRDTRDVRKGWARPAVMPTAKAKAYQDRQKSIIEAAGSFLGPPPEDEVLFEATLVIPAKQMYLEEIFDAECFDAVRKAHEVWIVLKKPNAIDIHSRTLRNLREAFREINWAIHDIRTAQHHVSSLFLVQLPLEGERSITVDLDCRPQVSLRTRPEQLISVQENSHVAHALMKGLRESFLSSMDALQGRPKQILQMRVDFGHVKIRRRKKIVQENGNPNEMRFAEFASMASQYGRRGGADFEARLQSSGPVLHMIRHILQPTTGFFHSHQNLSFHDTISIKLQEVTLEADIDRMRRGQAALKNVRLMEPDDSPPLKWTILAPDRKHDWCLRVDSGINLPMNPQISQLVNSIVVESDTHEEATTLEAFLQNPVHIVVENPRLLAGKVDRILLKSTVAVPFRDTPYVLDVSYHRTWEGVETGAHPNQSWQSLGFHGVHWAAELNSVNATDTRKDWGLHQRNVWRGSADSAEGQFHEFICYVLEGLSALDGVSP
ncbi:hypothetical protein E4U09_000078 [Claviceps aff. purpurea]|uniref:Uncharacterized protein n=1 Tax=Claviceps aff. purpurea TaxID=1967640 RepID=A0A9P7QNK7_9HYPO|nr:hypothetical protein E4U09_000078 [Claviceps aff. purpurea]